MRSKCMWALAIVLLAGMVFAGPASISAPALDDANRTSDYEVGCNSVQPERSGYDVITWTAKANAPEPVSRVAGDFDASGKFHLVCGNCQAHTSHPQEQIYNPATNAWSVGQTHPGGGTYGVHNHDAIALDGKIYVGGGSAGSGYYNNLTVIDPVAGTWDAAGAMPVSNLLYYKFATAAGKLYLFGGGVNGTTIQNICYEYDPGTTSWTQKANMPAVRRDVLCSGVGDTIYIFGGYDGTTAYSTMWKYSVTGDNYTTGTAVPVTLWWGRTAVYDDGVNGPVIYLMGGYTGTSTILNTVRTYTVATGAYGTETNMLNPRRSHAAALSADGKLIASCGYNSSGIMALHEMAVLAPPAGSDVGVELLRAPGTQVIPGTPIIPLVRYKNFGTSAQTNIPVGCMVDSMGTVIYDQSATIPALAANETLSVAFPAWTPGTALMYNVTVYCALAGDSNRANDTIHRTATTWQDIARPDTQDRIVHATVYDPVGDKIYLFGGNAAGASGTYRNIVRCYDPVANTWSAKANMTTARGWIWGAYCRGSIYIIGGHNNAGAAIATNEAYDIAANTWSTKAPRPAAALADMQVTWRDTLIYCLGGTNGTAGYDRVDIYDPASNTWMTGTALPAQADMGAAAIIGDTIYITGAVNRGASTAWTNLYKGYIDEADPTSITWIEGPAFPSATCIHGATAIGSKVYWAGGFINLATINDNIWCYDQADGSISVLPVRYPVLISRNNFLVGRPLAGELYGIAGDSGGNWAAPNRKYCKITVGEGVSGVAETPTLGRVTVDRVNPNPFGKGTEVSYSLPAAAEARVMVYSITGELVRTLVRGTQPAGSYSVVWNGRDDANRLVAPGIYYCRVQNDRSTATSKLIKLD